MSIEIIDILKPKNGLNFKLIEDIDIAVNGYTSLADAVAHFATKEGVISAINLALSGKQDTLSNEQLAACNSGITAQLVAQIGTNTTAIAGKADAADLAALAAVVDDKADESDLTTATANLQAQIDALITPVTQDAEVQNARVDAEGVSHTTLKARIDSTESRLTDEIDHIIDKTYTDAEYTNTSTYANSYNGYFDASGFNASASFISYSMRITKNTTIYCSSKNDQYFSICVYDTAALTSGTRYRFTQGGEDTLPYVASPLTLAKGKYVVFSTRVDDPAFKIVLTDYEAEISLDSALELASSQIQQVISEAGISTITADITNLSNQVAGIVTQQSIDVQFNQTSTYANTYNGYFGANGLVEDNGYISHVIEITKNTTIYCSNKNSMYFSICVYDNNSYTGGTRYRYVVGGEDSLPYENSALSLTAGQYVAFTTKTNDTVFAVILTDYISQKELSNTILLNSTQLTQVRRAVDKPCYLKYTGSDPNEVYTEVVDFYIPAKVGYTRYKFAHGVSQTLNCNIWHMRQAYAVDESFNDRFELTTIGEWELAIKPDGAPDFAGGTAHGDQIMSGIWWIIDGQKVDITQLTTLTEFKEIKVVETSTLYNPATPANTLATVGSEHIWTKDGLTINQAVTFDLAETLDISTAYMAMHLPAKTITDHYYTDETIAPVTCADNYGIIRGVKKETIYGDNSGITSDFWVTEYPDMYQTSDIFLITDNSGGLYNKSYFSVISNITETLPVGKTVWKSSSHYKFDIGK